MIRTSGAGSDSWIVPPASAARACAPARRRPRAARCRPSRRAAGQHFAKPGVEHDARPLAPDRDFQPVARRLRADVEAAAADQRVAGDQRQVEQQLHRALRQLLRRRPSSRARSGARPRKCPRARPSPRWRRSLRRTRRRRRMPGGRTSACWRLPGRCRASSSRHWSRISGSCSSASSSMPLLSAPTGDIRSWQSLRAQQAGEIDGVHGRVNEPEFNLAQVSAIAAA